MFSIPLWAIKWGAVALVIGVTWWHGHSSGRHSVLDRLKDDRITILKDGKKIDEAIDLADDAELCALLGSCDDAGGLRDDASGDKPL